MEIEHIIKLFREKRFKINSDRNMDVDSHNVMEVIRKGRTLLICDCDNDTKFCNESPICRHKQFFIMFPILNQIKNKCEKISEHYSIGRAISNTENEKNIYNIILDDIDNIRRFQ